MRVIAGEFKNRKIITPKGMDTRPTSEKMRGAVFNMLQHLIEGASFLDIFAGSGAMGFEALSRGAERVIFLERSKGAVQCIKKNIETFGVGNRARVIQGDVFSSLEKLKGSFDIIYVDPPYGQSVSKDLPEKLYSTHVLVKVDEGNLLKDTGKLLIEESKEVSLDGSGFSGLSFVDQRSFGRSALFQFERIKNNG